MRWLCHMWPSRVKMWPSVPAAYALAAGGAPRILLVRVSGSSVLRRVQRRPRQGRRYEIASRDYTLPHRFANYNLLHILPKMLRRGGAASCIVHGGAVVLFAVPIVLADWPAAAAGLDHDPLLHYCGQEPEVRDWTQSPTHGRQHSDGLLGQRHDPVHRAVRHGTTARPCTCSREIDRA